MRVELGSAGLEYAALRESFSSLIRSLSPHELALPVPSCPGWSVHDVVAHLAGVAADVVNGTHPTTTMDEWTAKQVADRVGVATSVVLREWERSSSQLEVLLDRSEEPLPANLLDLAVHDDDVRAAVDRPRTADSPVHDAMPGAFAGRFLAAVDRAGAGPIRIEDAGGEWWAGPTDAPVTIRVSGSYFVRASMGRRSRAQIEQTISGADDQALYVDLLCVFPPAPDDRVD